MNWWGKYIALPYGSGPGEYKCWGLIRLVYKQELNIELPEFEPVIEGSVLDALRVSRTFREELKNERWISHELPQEFDVVVMSAIVVDMFQSSRVHQHAGIYVNGSRILHTEYRAESHIVAMTHHSVCNRILAFCGYREKANV